MTVSAAPKLLQVRELLVWLPLRSGTTYLTLYYLATLLHDLHHLKKIKTYLHVQTGIYLLTRHLFTATRH